MPKRLAIILSLILTAAPLLAETAVFPYKVKTPSDFFTAEQGVEYSRLMSVGLTLRTGLQITSQRDVLADAGRHRIRIDGNVSADELAALGRGRYLEHIITGSLSRVGSGYMSEAILFSVKEGRVVQRARVTAGNFPDLAEKEIHDLFPSQERREPAHVQNSVDCVFLVDSSYSSAREWSSIRDGILEAAGVMTQRGDAAARMYIVPFSEHHSFEKASLADNSLMGLRKNLEAIKPMGGFSAGNFRKSLNYAVKSVTWRQGSVRHIVIITNSAIPASGFPEQYAVQARARGILIHSVILGRLRYDSAEVPSSLARMTGGSDRYVTYHQRLYNADARAIDLYFERGRLFYSTTGYGQWQKGLLESNRYQPGQARPRPGLDELQGRDLIPDPYGLPARYSAFSDDRVIRETGLENNIGGIINSLVAHSNASGKSAAGEVLVSDGAVSIWVSVESDADLRFFDSRRRSGMMFPMGMSFSADPARPYGIRPMSVSLRLESEDVPAVLKTGFTELIKKKDQCLNSGFFNPPVWFVTVRVQDIRSYGRRQDIRE
jgi:hypothetical protein